MASELISAIAVMTRMLLAQPHSETLTRFNLSRISYQRTIMTSSGDKGPSPAATNALLSSKTSDRAVRAALVDSYERLRNYLQGRLGAEAEEVLQAFVLRALERSDDIRNADSVRGWLSRVLASTIADFHRQTSNKKIRELPFAPELNNRLASHQGVEVNHAVCECLHAYLPMLKVGQAEIIRRIDLAGESRDLVAADIGVTVNNLTVRLHRARQVLKGYFEKMCVSCLGEDSFLECRCGEIRGKAQPAPAPRE
jgi:RNA polymerase sigma-70 factor (ECF subfamily)